MKHSLSLAAAALLLVATATAEPRQVQYEPPATPLSWRDLATEPRDLTGFSVPSNILGVPKLPVSVKRAELNDQHPYGEIGRRVVWLARYDSVTALVTTVTLAFDAATGKLICAFTDPSPDCGRSTEKTEEVGTRDGWTMHPARYESLHSAVTNVFDAARTSHPRWDASRFGQIIIRPRYNNNELGAAVPHEPASNVWIVEILGFIPHLPATTLVLVLRDGDLKQLIGAVGGVGSGGPVTDPIGPR